MKQQLTLYAMFLAIGVVGVSLFLGISVLANLSEQQTFYQSLTDTEAVQVANAELNCERVDCDDPGVAQRRLSRGVQQARAGIVFGIVAAFVGGFFVMRWGVKRLPAQQQ